MTEFEIEEEKREILRQYRKLLRHAKPFLKDDDAKIIKKAFKMSQEAHKNMRRRSGEPYIFHPLAVAQICVEEIGLGTTSIISALLHDVVEDTEMEIEDIERHFGKKVARIIDGLTKISGVFDYGTSQQAENFRKMLLTLSDDVRVILVKLADRLHNMRTLDSMPRHKQLRVSSETIYLYAPLAHRLGLYSIKSELEDLFLKYSEPVKYAEIVDKINASKAPRDRFVRNFINPIQKELSKRDLKFTIKGRPKSIYSIWNKMTSQEIGFEKVYDLFAIRIILDLPPEMEKAGCWQVYSVVTDYYQPNPDRLRDWISTPKSNGYESLHTTVMSKTGTWVEVQIRTKRMDEIAEKGYAAHWKYKESDQSSTESGLEIWISKVREILERENASAIEFVDDFKHSLFNEEIFVFTPKGELKKLPGGASALDFAFEIHSEIGARCIGAKVNQKLVPINHKLKTGDQVEILTSNKQKPNEGWLSFVITSKGRTRIKDELKEQKKSAASEGREIVKRKLKQAKLELNSENLDKLLNRFNLKSALDFYYLVGKGKIDPKDIKKIKSNSEKPRKSIQQTYSDIESFQRTIKEVTGEKRDQLLIGEDMDIVQYSLAPCCNPIPGDDVFGFVSTHEGIKIHRINCPNATELLSKHGHRVVKAKWTSQSEVSFLAGLKIRGTDRVGMMNDVTKIISSELKVNMRSIAIESENGIFDGSIQLYVQNTKHLEMLTKKLENIEGVEEVARFDIH
ncbi:MAG: bifunctional (p)ppGpp synthetase/guanosine-3',5'-bis(diphosphate) 3'-pyrophosphohydrolase [Cyclobacteriaceae bacterium]|nr:bifunctional (p)ppGpp synthetase/guanosine-3',5'-bis(diphosphate) 3'-pyrophosphohydrolase [Cyclobacteriaceae bacterium]